MSEKQSTTEAYNDLNTFDKLCISIDQPRKWYQLLAKAAFYGTVQSGCVVGGLAVRDAFKKRKEGKILTMPANNKKVAQ